MKETLQILQISEVLNLLRISRPTLYRWLAESRKGTGHFPLPISQSKRKLLWNAEDIEAFCLSQAAPSVNVPSPAKQAKVAAKRREETIATLRKHGLKTADELSVPAPH